MDKRKLPKKWYYDGKKYKIVWRKPRNAEGKCEDPKNNAENRAIHINPNLETKDLVEVILHESLHAELFLLDEETVERVAANLTDILFEWGFTIEKPN